MMLLFASVLSATLFVVFAFPIPASVRNRRYVASSDQIGLYTPTSSLAPSSIPSSAPLPTKTPNIPLPCVPTMYATFTNVPVPINGVGTDQLPSSTSATVRFIQKKVFYTPMKDCNHYSHATLRQTVLQRTIESTLHGKEDFEPKPDRSDTSDDISSNPPLSPSPVGEPDLRNFRAPSPSTRPVLLQRDAADRYGDNFWETQNMDDMQNATPDDISSSGTKEGKNDIEDFCRTVIECMCVVVREEKMTSMMKQACKSFEQLNPNACEASKQSSLFFDWWMGAGGKDALAVEKYCLPEMVKPYNDEEQD